MNPLRIPYEFIRHSLAIHKGFALALLFLPGQVCCNRDPDWSVIQAIALSGVFVLAWTGVLDLPLFGGARTGLGRGLNVRRSNLTPIFFS